MPSLTKETTKGGKVRWVLYVREIGYDAFKRRFDTEDEAIKYCEENYPNLSIRAPRPRLNIDHRRSIQDMLQKGHKILDISRALGFSYKAIKQEINKYGGIDRYDAETANIESQTHAPKNNYDSRIQSLEMQLEIVWDELKALKEKIK